MPGFESKRFINITESDIEDLMCGICLGIVNDPFQAKCCKQLYCFQCINEWLRCSHTCPYDRSQLSIEDLQRSGKHSKAMENFEIHCEYESHGCEQIVLLKDLSKHQNECEFDPERKCNTCGLTMGDVNQHNCIQLLIKEKERFRKESIALKAEIDGYKQRIFDEERHCWDDPLWCV